MNERDQLIELREKITKLNDKEKKLRDVYLRNISLGKVYGPETGFASIDKKWLKDYKEEDILKEDVNESIYDYVFKKGFTKEEALNYFGSTTSFEKLDKQIEIFANNMLKKGVKPGDTVTICMPNTPEGVIAFYGLNKAGIVANMIHPLSSENEIKNFINETSSEYVIIIDSSVDKLDKVIDDTNIKEAIVVSPSNSMPFGLKVLYNLTKKINLKHSKKITSWKNFMDEKCKTYEKGTFKNNDTAVMLHTGGTTGKTKAAELTNKNFNMMVEQFKSNADNFEIGDRMLTIMPIFHGFGLCSSLHLPLSFGVSCVLIPKLDAKNIDRLFKKYKPNHILGVPTLFKAIINNKNMDKMDLSYIKYIVAGGDMIKESLENDINSFFKNHGSNSRLANGWGFTEGVAGNTFSKDDCSSIGIPSIKTNVRVTEPGTTKELPEGEIGEFCVAGPSIMKGYYNNPEENKKVFNNGWLYTGDSGYYKDGKFYFAERRANMIISSGVNVYPGEIERVIENHEAVSACAVIGVNHPYKIQVPKAYIILKEGYEATEELQNEIIELCSKNLNKYSIPNKIEFREVLPQTLLGKISKKDLKDEQLTKKLVK